RKRRPRPEILWSAETVQTPRLLVAAHDRLALPIPSMGAEARPAPFRHVDYEAGNAPFEETPQPARPAVGRMLPAGSGEPAAMDEQQWQPEAAALGDEVL